MRYASINRLVEVDMLGLRYTSIKRNAHHNVNRDYGDGVFKGMWIGIATGPRV